MADAYNKNSAGGPKRLNPTGADGRGSADAGMNIMNSWFGINEPAQPFVQQLPSTGRDMRPAYIRKMDTEEMRNGKVKPLYRDPARDGKRPAYLDQFNPKAQPVQPAQAPEPSDGFGAYVAREKMMKGQQATGVVPPSYMWDGRWKNKGPAGGQPSAKSEIDPALVNKLASTYKIDPDAVALPAIPQETDAEQPDDTVHGPEAAIDPALLQDQSQPEIPPDEATGDPLPVGEHPLDKDILPGLDAGHTPVPETPEESDRLEFLISQRAASRGEVRDGQGPMRDQIARLEGYSQMDYRPLAALVDSWTGSKLAPSFAGPIDREPLIANLQEAIQNNNRHLSEQDRQELRDYEANKARALKAEKVVDHTWQDGRDLRKERAAQKRAETYAGARKLEREDKVTLDADVRDTALSERLADSFDAKSAGTISRLNAALVNYRNLVKAGGVSILGGTFLADAKQKEIDSAYAAYTALAKDEKTLGALTVSDRQLIEDTVASNTGLVAMKDFLTGSEVSGIVGQIDRTLSSLKASSSDKLKRLRGVAGTGKNPRTHEFIDRISSELSVSEGVDPEEALAVSTLREHTRALAAKRAAKKAAESKGGTP